MFRKNIVSLVVVMLSSAAAEAAIQYNFVELFSGKTLSTLDVTPDPTVTDVVPTDAPLPFQITGDGSAALGVPNGAYSFIEFKSADAFGLHDDGDGILRARGTFADEMGVPYNGGWMITAILPTGAASLQGAGVVTQFGKWQTASAAVPEPASVVVWIFFLIVVSGRGSVQPRRHT